VLKISARKRAELFGIFSARSPVSTGRGRVAGSQVLQLS